MFGKSLGLSKSSLEWASCSLILLIKGRHSTSLSIVGGSAVITRNFVDDIVSGFYVDRNGIFGVDEDVHVERVSSSEGYSMVYCRSSVSQLES